MNPLYFLFSQKIENNNDSLQFTIRTKISFIYFSIFIKFFYKNISDQLLVRSSFLELISEWCFKANCQFNSPYCHDVVVKLVEKSVPASFTIGYNIFSWKCSVFNSINVTVKNSVTKKKSSSSYLTKNNSRRSFFQ